jgi:hypothetical protein
MNKEMKIRQIQQNSRLRAGEFARQLAGSTSDKKEEILAGLEFEKWLADTCCQCLG